MIATGNHLERAGVPIEITWSVYLSALVVIISTILLPFFKSSAHAAGVFALYALLRNRNYKWVVIPALIGCAPMPPSTGSTFRPTTVNQRNLRLGVAERTLASGQIERPLDEQAVLDRAKALLEAGCEALCIAFINSYANSENEQRAGEIARSVWPNDHVTVSSDILPEIREFERVSTAVLN
ncbi:MAG: hypothetical protein EBY63_06440, partial [Flavobacteriia bacterium]|nr:hypothetical protein [Flavobacteriia bacterium]